MHGGWHVALSLSQEPQDNASQGNGPWLRLLLAGFISHEDLASVGIDRVDYAPIVHDSGLKS